MKLWVSALNMRPTLRRRAGFRFSEIAVLMGRVAAPGHHDARGDVARGPRAHPPRLAVRGRRHPEHAGERAAECPQAREPDLEADLGYRAVRLAQERHRPLEPSPLQVAVRGLPEGPLE